jgi:REase_MTES_1575/AAA domain
VPEQPASRSLAERDQPAVVGQSGQVEALAPADGPIVPATGPADRAADEPASAPAADRLSVDRLTVAQTDGTVDGPETGQAHRTADRPDPTVDLAADPAAEVDPVSRAVAGWRACLTADGGPDSTLAGAVQSGSWLDLTHAHPSGLAQLLAGRPTRLSSLVREAAAHTAARRRARSIRAAATTLATDRGVRGCFLAAGVVRWGSGGAAVSAPVLLRGCTLRPRGTAAEDFDLTLDDGAVVNAELLRAIGAAYGINVDGAELSALAFGQRGFDPRPVYEWLEDRCIGLPGFRLERSLVVATFTAGTGAVLADLDAAAAVIERHDLLRRIAGRRPAGDAPKAAPDQAGSAVLLAAGARHGLLPGGRERDEQPRPFDLDPAQRSAVEAVLTGTDLAIEGPPGTGVTQTLATAAAVLAGTGKRVLVLCPRRAGAEAFLARLRSAGLGDLAFDVRDGGSDRAQVLAALIESLDLALAHAGAIATPPPVGGPVHRITDLPAAPAAPPGLLRARDRLAGASAALHQQRAPWGVSAYQAMVAWAELTARSKPPRTRIRLPEPVLAKLDTSTRERLRTHLHLAAASGGLSMTAVDTRWHEAQVATDPDARKALSAAQDARDGFAEAVARLEAVAAGAGLAAPGTVSGWRPLLELLLDLRDTLDVLLPAVFEQPLAELIAAVGPTRVRDAGPAERLRRRRRAAALVRPGVHLPDLHARLAAAAAQRDRWQQLTGGETWPRIPTGLDQAWAMVTRLEAALATLAEAFGGEARVGLLEVPVDDLARRLDDLAGDEGGILGQPRRITLLRGLRDAGLGPLVDDLRRRRAADDEVDGELDLAWWGGVLEAIVNGDNRLARHDGRALRAAADDLAEGDRSQIADAAQAVLDQRAARVLDVLRRRPEQETFVREQAAIDPRAAWPADLFRQAPELVAALRPIWLMSPDAVARCLPAPAAEAARLDCVLVDDAAGVGMFEAVAALSRAAQVVIGGDRLGLPPPDGTESVMTAVCEVAGVYRLDRDHRTRDGRLLTPIRGRYAQRWDAVPGASPNIALRLDLVGDGMALPAMGEELAISPDAEVRRVVDLVAEHAALRPDESLVVVTLGERHAERIEEALQLATRSRGILARWLEDQRASGAPEPFLIRSAGKLQGLERDAAIVTVGLARTPHARVVHRFGALDSAAGAGYLVAALSRARRRTTVVSCFSDEDLQPDRLHSDGAKLLRTALQVAAGRQSQPLRPGPAPNALVADLKARLEIAGMPVQAGVGDPNWPIDLVLSDPQQLDRKLLAVDLDGPGYAAHGLRERDRQRRERLERAGWAYCRVSAMDVFSDPDAEVDRVRRAWIRALLDREREVPMIEPELVAAVRGDGAQDQVPEPVLPEQTVDDTDVGWGEGGDREPGNDQRLLDERPPHWQ